MKDKIFISIIFVLMNVVLSAQSNDKSIIDKIKSDTAYYFAEGTGKDKNEARENALLEINKELHTLIIAEYLHNLLFRIFTPLLLLMILHVFKFFVL